VRRLAATCSPLVYDEQPAGKHKTASTSGLEDPLLGVGHCTLRLELFQGAVTGQFVDAPTPIDAQQALALFSGQGVRQVLVCVRRALR